MYAIAGGVAVGHVTFFASPEAYGADASIVNKWSNVAAEDSLDAEVVEEDTALVLSAPVKASLKDSMHPVRLYTALHEFEEFAAGTLLMTAGSPVRVRAVVYNFEADVPIRQRDVLAVLDEIWTTAATAGWHCLALPVFGAHARCFTIDELALTLRASLERPAAAPLVVRLRGSQERVQATLTALSAGAGVSGPSTKC